MVNFARPSMVARESIVIPAPTRATAMRHPRIGFILFTAVEHYGLYP
jgi:hypothetical protein